MGTFTDVMQPTTGLNVQTATCHCCTGAIQLKIWDTSGHERCRAILPQYYWDARWVIVVYSVSDRQSFRNVERWVEELRSSGVQNIAMAANKVDLNASRQVTFEEGNSLAAELGIKQYQISAKTALNIVSMFQTLAGIIALDLQNPRKVIKTLHLSDCSPSVRQPRDKQRWRQCLRRWKAHLMHTCTTCGC